MRRRGPRGYVPALRGVSPTQQRRQTQRLVRELRRLEAADALGGAIRSLPPPSQAPPVEVDEGLDVFRPVDNSDLYVALRGLGTQRVKVLIRWENKNGQRHTTMLFSHGGVRASYIVAGAVGKAGDVFGFLLEQLNETKYKGQPRRILSVTIEYASWAVA